MKILDSAVGAGAFSLQADVKRVECLLGLAGYGALRKTMTVPAFSSLTRPKDACSASDGDLEMRIRRFQREVVGLRSPDGKIDPGGTTITALLAEARKRVFLERRQSRVYDDARITEAIGRKLPEVVKGDIQKPHLVEARTIGALRLIGYMCGLDQMKITEGIRTYEMMATYFLTGVTNGRGGVRGESYRHALEILKQHHKGLPYGRGQAPAEHVQAVADRMRTRCQQLGVRVSRHVVSETEYAQLNVIDLGWNSNPKLKDVKRARAFARILDSFHVKNPAAKHGFIRTYHPPHYLNPALNSPYARELTVEKAWHIEFLTARIPREVV